MGDTSKVNEYNQGSGSQPTFVPVEVCFSGVFPPTYSFESFEHNVSSTIRSTAGLPSDLRLSHLEDTVRGLISLVHKVESNLVTAVNVIATSDKVLHKSILDALTQDRELIRQLEQRVALIDDEAFIIK